MPPVQEHDIEEMDDISTVQDDAGASQEARNPAASASSAENDVSNTVADDDALSAVREVVGERSSEETSASSAKGEEDPGAAGDPQPRNPTDDESYSDVPFNKHPRFQQVLGRLKRSEQDAERYQHVQRFIDDQGLAAEEAAEMLTIGGLIKSNPAEAWRRMKPTVEAVLRASGEVLSPELEQRVQAGEMSAEAALLVSRTKAEADSYRIGQTLEQQRAARRQQTEAEAAQAEAASALMTTAQTWEDDRRAKDPNFDAKLPAILTEARRLQEMGWRPTTPEAVTEQLRRAYASVNAKLQPRAQFSRPPVAPVRGGQMNGAARPAPKNTLDIINSVVGQRAAG